MKKIFGILIVFIVSLYTSAAFADSVHWDKNNLNVFIAKGPKSHLMARAFSTWQEKLNNRITFSYTDKNSADIIVLFKEEVSGKDGDVGDYIIKSNGEIITKAQINIAKSSYRQYSNEYIFVVMQHEIGHALGLDDTEGTSLGIMHFPITEEQTIKPSSIRRLHAVYKDTDILMER